VARLLGHGAELMERPAVGDWEAKGQRCLEPSSSPAERQGRGKCLERVDGAGADKLAARVMPEVRG